MASNRTVSQPAARRRKVKAKSRRREDRPLSADDRFMLAMLNGAEYDEDGGDDAEADNEREIDPDRYYN